jgi:hypothetical protein
MIYYLEGIMLNDECKIDSFRVEVTARNRLKLTESLLDAAYLLDESMHQYTVGEMLWYAQRGVYRIVRRVDAKIL